MKIGKERCHGVFFWQLLKWQDCRIVCRFLGFKMGKLEHNKDITTLLQLVEKAVSPYHAVEEGCKQLIEAGFEELKLSENWSLDQGKKYFVNAYGTTLIAFRVNPEFDFNDTFRIAAAHTDWPCLRIKPNPDMTASRYRKLNVEVYGGPILNTWLDRPLSIAGRVSVKGKDCFHPESRLINFKRPLITIPNVAIHMNRNVNAGIELNPQIDLLPLIGMVKDELSKENYFLRLLADELEIGMDDIYDFDLYVYNYENGCVVGANEEFVSAPRLDNLTSCQACLNGIIEGSRAGGIDVIALFDNEECGSRSKQGADSVLLTTILEKVMLCFGRSREHYLTMMMNSFLLSVDVAHAIHPNHPEKCDVTNQICMDDGVAIKMESNQRYATDSTAVAVVEALCKEGNIPYRKFANRSDIRGGGTLGSITSATLPMRTVDIGIPMLAMHSSRELMGVESQTQLNRLLKSYFTK